MSRTTWSHNGSSCTGTFCPLPFLVFHSVSVKKQNNLGGWSSQFFKAMSTSAVPVNRLRTLSSPTCFNFGAFRPSHPTSHSARRGRPNTQATQTLVIIPHQRLGSWGRQISGSANIHPAVSDMSASVYGTCSPACFTLTPADSSLAPTLFFVLSSLIWPRHPGSFWPRLWRLSYYHNYPGGIAGNSHTAEAVHV